MKKKTVVVDLLKHKQSVKPHIESVVTELGYGLHNLAFVTENQINYLRVAISHPDKSIALDDCETVSRSLSKKLDEVDLIPCAYTLEVESPGIDINIDESELESSELDSFDVKGFGKVKVGES